MFKRFLNDTFEGLKIAGGAVKGNPVRSTLTMLGIIIGIVTVTLMGAFLIGINDMFRQTVSFMGTDVYYVDKWDWGGGKSWMLMRNRPIVTQKEADEVRRRMTTAQAVAVNADQWGVQAKSRDHSVESMTAVGVDEPYQVVGSIVVEKGRFMSTAELMTARPVTVIGAELADKLFPTENPIGQTIRLSGYPMTVIGVAKRVGGMFGVFTVDNQAIMPLRAFFNAFGDPHRTLTIAVKARDVRTKTDTREEVEAVFRQIRGLKPQDDNNFGINSQDQFNKQIDQLTSTLDWVGFMITGLSLLVGGIGIMNIMFVTVKERTREIGIRKAIGARRRSILVQFLAEASMLSMMAGAIALVVSISLTFILNRTALDESSLQIIFPASLAFMGIALSAIIGILSGFFPAWRASRLDPVEALRYE